MKRKKKVFLTVIVTCLAVSLFGIAACTPQAKAPSEGATAEASSTESSAGDQTGVPGDFRNKDAGMLTESGYSTNFINAGNRGCNACHADLWDTIKDSNPSHLLSSPPGYGQAYAISDCLPCHTLNMVDGAPKLSEIIHVSHYSNAEFVDEKNGTCWSCHASDNAGDMVLWDVYKYSDELGGYPNSADPHLREFLTNRPWRNGHLADVVTLPDFKLDVELSQPVSDEKDMYVANNYPPPEVSANTYELKVTGVKNERSFTLDELKAMPQIETIVAQNCFVNSLNGVMIGNIPIKGVLLKDLIDACGGVAEGNNAVDIMGLDKWVHPVSVDFLLEQDAMIALEYWGHELTVAQGYPATLAIPGVGGVLWIKWLGELNFNDNPDAYANVWDWKDYMPFAYQGVQLSGWFTPGKDGEEFKVGEEVELSGYAYQCASSGHTMSQVAFSADYGNTWTTIDVPKDFDQKQWVRYNGTWTPEKAGVYVLQVKSVDSLGSEQSAPASVIIKVTE